jgi:hypothetical protein
MSDDFVCAFKLKALSDILLSRRGIIAPEPVDNHLHFVKIVDGKIDQVLRVTYLSDSFVTITTTEIHSGTMYDAFCTVVNFLLG